MINLPDLRFLSVGLDRWLVGAAILIGGMVIATLIRTVALTVIRSRRRKNLGATDSRSEPPDGDPSFTERTIRSFLYPLLILASVVGAVLSLPLPESATAIVLTGARVVVSVLIILFLTALVRQLFSRAASSRSSSDFSSIRPLQSLLSFLIWVAGLLFLFDNLGFEITAILAGLGVGGIAVALGAQVVFGDLFSYFVIVLDRPYEVGDFLIFGEVLGTVERIGVKTTRIRSLDGELVIISNSDLTQSRVRNYKQMETRRAVFRIGVEYATPVPTLKAIPGVIREIVERQDGVRFDRAHFATFGESELTFETVYTVLSPDYNVYMDIQEQLNIEIVEAFQRLDVQFAFPTRTVHLNRT